MSVDFSQFHDDMARWERERPSKERELYDATRADDDGAAAELQFWRTRFGKLESQDVRR